MYGRLTTAMHGGLLVVQRTAAWGLVGFGDPSAITRVDALVRILVARLVAGTWATRPGRRWLDRLPERRAIPPDAARVWGHMCVGGSVVAAILTVAVLAMDRLQGEATLRDLLVASASPVVVAVASWANYGGRWQVLAPLAVLLLGASTEARRRWWLWAPAVISAPLLAEVWKALVARPRPAGHGLGFPSGHAAAAAAFALMIVYWAGRARIPSLWRRVIRGMAVAVMLLVGLARIVLGAHWPGDVLMGFALGIACAAGAAWLDAGGTSPSAYPALPEPDQSRPWERAA